MRNIESGIKRLDTELRRQFDERLANEHLIAEKTTEYMKIFRVFRNAACSFVFASVIIIDYDG